VDGKSLHVCCDETRGLLLWVFEGAEGERCTLDARAASPALNVTALGDGARLMLSGLTVVRTRVHSARTHTRPSILSLSAVSKAHLTDGATTCVCRRMPVRIMRPATASLRSSPTV